MALTFDLLINLFRLLYCFPLNFTAANAFLGFCRDILCRRAILWQLSRRTFLRGVINHFDVGE